jgi:hypothetical protein
MRGEGPVLSSGCADHYCDIALRVAFSGRLRLYHTMVWGAGRIKEYGRDEAYYSATSQHRTADHTTQNVYIVYYSMVHIFV